MTELLDDPKPSEATCQHLHVCGGCPAMGLPYQKQLASKRERVAGPVSRYPELAAVRVDEVLGAELRLEYRTRAKLMVSEDSSVGLYARDRDHQVVDLPGCLVLAPRVAHVVAGLRAGLADGSLGLAAGRELVAVDVREAEGGQGTKVLLTLVVRRDRRPTDAALAAAARRMMATLPEIGGVAVNFRTAGSVQVLGSETRLLAGQAVLADTIGGTFHHATFGAFTQVNRQQAARVHAMVADAIAALRGGIEGKRVLELYGGTGALGLGLARRGATVDMVESFAPAVERAKDAAREQGLGERFHALAGDAGRATLGAMKAARRYDVVVVNPPRRGMAPATRAAVAQAGPAAIGYVSCDPDTLARDLADLAVRGFVAERIRPLDMIPQTHEVESFAWLQRGPLPAPRIVAERDDVVAAIKPGHERVGARAEGRWKVLGRGRAPLVQVGHLDADASGLVVWAGEQRAAEIAAAVGGLESREAYIVLCVGKVMARGRRVGRWRRLALVGGHSLVRVDRAGMGAEAIARELAQAGMRVVGDRRFGHRPTNSFFEEKHTLDRAFVHRLSIEMALGPHGGVWRAQAPLAGDLVTVLVRLGGEKILAHPAVGPLLSDGA